MEHLATMDSEFILPDFPPDNNDDSNPKDRNDSQTLLNRKSSDDMDTNIEIKEEVDFEVGEVFTGRSENDETVFPTGLILIHDQPTLPLTATATVTNSQSRKQSHLLSCTPVYMDENGTSPSYLQMSAQNPETQVPSRSTRFSPRLHPSTNLSPPQGISSANGVETNLETLEERKRRQKAESARRVRERKRKIESPNERAKRLAAHAERLRISRANETPEQRASRRGADAERQRKRLANETPEQRTKRLVADLKRQRMRLANETPEQRASRLAADAERQRKYLANETPEQRKIRLGRHAQLQRNYLMDETPEQRIARLAGASDLIQCEFCEKSLAPRSLKDHISRHHSRAEDKKFKCDHCEKTFALECDQKAHKLTHSMEKRFICEKCGKGYKDRAGLKNHIIFKHRFDEDVQEKYWRE